MHHNGKQTYYFIQKNMADAHEGELKCFLCRKSIDFDGEYIFSIDAEENEYKFCIPCGKRNIVQYIKWLDYYKQDTLDIMGKVDQLYKL